MIINQAIVCERCRKNAGRPGIYLIRNTVNGKVYVGSSTNVMRRLCFHKSRLNTNKHFNPHLLASWNKNGSSAFEFEIIEECDVSELEQKEESLILSLKSSNPSFGYNNTLYARANMRGRKGTNSPLFGRKRSKEIMQPMRDANSGTKHYLSRAVDQYSQEGVLVKRWNYISEAAKAMNIDRTNIGNSCKRKVKRVRGFFWRYADDSDPHAGITIAVKPKKVTNDAS